MTRISLNSSGAKIFIGALVAVIVFGAVIMAMSDVKVPTKHVSNNIEVGLDN